MRVFTDLNTLPVFHNAVLTIGSFDGVHTGHQFILHQLKDLATQCGGESVVITFDPHPRTVLKPDDVDFKLITSTQEKIALLESMGIDHVVVVPFSIGFALQSAQAYVEQFLLEKFRPHSIVIGYDHRFGNRREGGIAFLRQYEAAGHFHLIEIPAQEVDAMAVSSTKIRKALETSNIKLANKLLGHNFTLSGTVVQGNQIGRTIGFPTANIAVDTPHKLILPEGIYAAQVQVQDKTFDAMLYLGQRPSVETDGSKVVEVNLIDFEGDLYGQYLSVAVLDFIRPDQKFDSLAALQQQISLDKIAILHTLKKKNPVQVQGKTDLAIVILNYNTRKHLATYLPSVIQHSAGHRIILVDNGSPDDSVAYVRAHFPDIEILDLKVNYGFAEGYNQALKQIKADYYLILNSDVEVTENWIDPVLEAMEHDPTIGIAQPKIITWADKTRFEYAGASGGWIDNLGYPFCRGRIFNHLEADQGQYDTPQACFWASGAAFFIRASLYHRFGGFDGDYFAHNEEIDLCWRLKRAGYSVWCIPQSVVYHLGGGTLEYESPRKVFLNFRNSLFSLLKNETVPRLLFLIPARLILDGVAAFRFAVKGQFNAIGAILRAHGSFYSNFRATLIKRRINNALVAQFRIGPANHDGIYRGSIVFRHYVGRIKEFKVLMRSKM